MLRVLIISRGFHHQGGVVNFIRTLISNFSSDIAPVHFEISANDNKNIFRRMGQIFFDKHKLSKILRSNQFDCIHYNPSLNSKSFYRDGYFIRSALRTSSRIIIYFHGWDDKFANKLLSSKHLQILFNSSYAKADKIFVLASDFERVLIKLGVPQEKIIVTTTMFEAHHIPDVTLNKSKNKKNIKILFLSRLIKEKGVMELIDAFKLIIDEFNDAILIIAGDGPDKNRAVDRVHEYDIESHVNFTGYVREEDKRMVLKEADIFVLPTSHGEGCPVSILEAMASGLAIITTSVGGLSNILTNNENGIIISTPCSEAIHKALKLLIINPELRNKIAENARKKAWSRYESSIVTRSIEKVYQEAYASK